MKKIISCIFAALLVSSISALEIGVQGNINEDTSVLHTYNGDTKRANIDAVVTVEKSYDISEDLKFNYGATGKLGYVKLFGDMKDNVYAEDYLTKSQVSDISSEFASTIALAENGYTMAQIQQGVPSGYTTSLFDENEAIAQTGCTYSNINGIKLEADAVVGLEYKATNNISFGLNALMGPNIYVVYGDVTQHYRLTSYAISRLALLGQSATDNWTEISTKSSWLATLGLNTSIKPYMLINNKFKVYNETGCNLLNLTTRFGNETQRDFGAFKSFYCAFGVSYKL